MGVAAGGYESLFRALFQLTNLVGAVVTMPHKVSTVALLDEYTDAVRIAGSCNAVIRAPDGKLVGDMFDGAGFVRGLMRKSFVCKGASCLVVGAGGVGSAIAAALAQAGVASIACYDTNPSASEGLRKRLSQNYPDVQVEVRPPRPAGYDLAVNATPLGMSLGDPLPMDIADIGPTTFVGEVVMKQEITPLLHAARMRGLPDAGRHRHVVRADSAVPRVLRSRHRGTRGVEGARAPGLIHKDASPHWETGNEKKAAIGNEETSSNHACPGRTRGIHGR
jgi:shikimate dehydrogenase